MRIAVLLLMLSGALPVTAAEPAAQVLHVYGEATARSADGTVRRLRRGDDVFVGDRVGTSQGRLQLRFVDGGIASLRAETELSIEDYRYAPAGSGGSAVLALVRGGLRAITGLIGGARNPEGYRLKTAVATIGIRGTAFDVWDCLSQCIALDGEVVEGVHIQTIEGELLVANAAGSLILPAGQAAVVPERGARPRINRQPPSLSARDRAVAKQRRRVQIRLASQRRTRRLLQALFASGDQFDEGGTQQLAGLNAVKATRDVFGVAVTRPDPQSPNGAFIGSGLRDNALVGSMGELVGIAGFNQAGDLDNLATVNLAAMLNTGFPKFNASLKGILENTPLAAIRFFLERPARPVSNGGAGPLRWGAWSRGRVLDTGTSGVDVREYANFQAEHFILGPRPQTPLPPSGQATYTFAGGTGSTAVDGSSVGAGVTGGALSVDFAAASVAIDLDLEHAGSSYDVSGQARIGAGPGQNFLFAGQGTAIGGGNDCVNGCGARFDGFFSGGAQALPQGAGLAYGVNETPRIQGVAGFELTP